MNWMFHDWRAYGGIAVAASAGLFWIGVFGDVRALRDQRLLDGRGVSTTATVVRYSYDENGGDPGGWTTDSVRFTTRSGVVINATVGHHDLGPEARSKSMSVTYDPLDPSFVRATGYANNADDWVVPAGGAVLAGGTSVGGVTLLFWTVRRRRNAPTEVQKSRSVGSSSPRRAL